MASAILAHAHQLTREGGWHLRTAVVMPEHVHLVFALGDRLVLSDVVRLFKGRLSPVLRAAKLIWERGYFDHRIRPTEDRLPVFLYIFLNPYRAGFLPLEESWPAYYCHPDDWVWLEPLTRAACPFPEWLQPCIAG